MAIGVLIKRCSLIAGDTLLAEARNLTIARMQNVLRVLPNRDREGVGACADCSSPAIFFVRNIGVKRKAPPALAREKNGGSPSIADRIPRRLPRPHHDGDFILQPHPETLQTPLPTGPHKSSAPSIPACTAQP